MSRQDLKYLRNSAIEDITAARIREYERMTGTAVSLPVPVESIIEQVLGLDFDWDEIEEGPGEQILGGLVAAQKKIVLNEKHLDLFKEKPGLARSTMGHEAGHWDIDIDRASINHPSFEGFPVRDCTVDRHSKKNDLIVKVLNRAATDDRYYQVYKKIVAGQDSPEVRSAVDRYQSALLMPSWLMRAVAKDFDTTQWPDLYNLAGLTGVTISNLTVRLQRLEILFIPEGSRTLYRSREAFSGQGELF